MYHIDQAAAVTLTIRIMSNPTSQIILYIFHYVSLILIVFCLFSVVLFFLSELMNCDLVFCYTGQPVNYGVINFDITNKFFTLD